MRIAFMIYDKPNYFGGPITNARRILPELQKRGHEVHAMIFFRDYSPATEYLQAQGIKCHIQPRPKYTERQIRWILKTLQEINPDIFVPNIFVSGWYAARWVQQAGIPAIAAYRSDDAYYWGMVNEFVVGKPEWSVAGLVCVSNYLKEKVEALNPQRTQLCVIPSGVPVPKQTSCQTGPLKIVYAGRLVQQQKRIHETITALIRVAKTYPDIQITLIGDGNEREHLKQQIEAEKLRDRIHLKGTIASEDLHYELIKHDVLVLLSDYEGTPGSVMDGMACGLIPVCLDIKGGVRELVIPYQTGLLVADRTKSFQKAIQRIQNNPDLRLQLSQNARAHIIKNYSLPETVSRWENLFAKLAKDNANKTSIKTPRFYKLPSVKPGLNWEDFRASALQSRTVKYLAYKVKQIMKR